MIAISVDDVLDHLGIDYADDMVTRKIKRLIPTADKFLKSSLGKDYPIDDPRAQELALIVIADMYDNRGLSGSDKVSGNTRRLVDDFSLQIRLELKGGVSNE